MPNYIHISLKTAKACLSLLEWHEDQNGRLEEDEFVAKMELKEKI